MPRRRWSSGLPRHAWWVEVARSIARTFGPRWGLARRAPRRPRAPRPTMPAARERGRRGLLARDRGGPGPGTMRSTRRWPRLSRRPPWWYRLLKWAAALAMVALVLFAIVDWRLRPTLHQMVKAQARVLATEAVTQAVATEIAEDIRWEDLYALRPDSTGRVVLVQPNTAEIDRLTSKVTIRVQENLKKITEAQVRIPLGQVLGSHVLANIGPRIPISVVPLGTVTTRILSDFEQAGINQIRHKIYLDIAAHIKLVVPLVVSTVDVTVQVPITEVLIMGDVPETYIQLHGSELRNLLQQQQPAPGE